MKTIDEILKNNHALWLQKKTPFENSIDPRDYMKLSMEQYAQKQSDYYKVFYYSLIERKIKAATWKAFVQFEPYIESDNAIRELHKMHDEFLKTFKFSGSDVTDISKPFYCIDTAIGGKPRCKIQCDECKLRESKMK